MEMYLETESDFAFLTHDLLQSDRQNEHMMWDQLNQQYSTILVAAVVMISSLAATLGQGVLDPASPRSVEMLYAVMTGVSVLCLFLCDVLCIEVIRRLSGFMRHRNGAYRASLDGAIAKAKAMVRVLRHVDADDKPTLGGLCADEVGRPNALAYVIRFRSFPALLGVSRSTANSSVTRTRSARTR